MFCNFKLLDKKHININFTQEQFTKFLQDVANEKDGV